MIAGRVKRSRRISPILSQFLLLAAAFIAGALLYRWWNPIVSRLKRFDDRNAARREEEFQALFDPNAHYRQTLRVVEEQFEPVQEYREPDPKTGVNLPRFVFLGVDYDTRAEAEAARRKAIIDRARAFYIDMDTMVLRRGAQHERTPDAPGLPAPKRE